MLGKITEPEFTRLAERIATAIKTKKLRSASYECVQCSFCGALPGFSCIAGDGQETKPHTARIKTAQRKRVSLNCAATNDETVAVKNVLRFVEKTGYAIVKEVS